MRALLFLIPLIFVASLADAPDFGSPEDYLREDSTEPVAQPAAQEVPTENEFPVGVWLIALAVVGLLLWVVHEWRVKKLKRLKL